MTARTRLSPSPFPGVLRLRLKTDKPVEDGFSIGFRDTLAPVGHLKSGPAFAAQDPDLDFAAVGIFERIIEQIGERLRQQVTRAANSDARLGGQR